MTAAETKVLPPPDSKPDSNGVLRELFSLLAASFKPEEKSGRFLPFDAYPSRFRPPMKKPVR